MEYEYGVLDYQTLHTSKNNGNLAKQKITVGTVGQTPGFVAQQCYLYDELNRLEIASETLTPPSQYPQQWIQWFNYDRYGNRTFNESQTTTLPKNCGTPPNVTVCTHDRKIYNPSINPASNRLNTSEGYAFDAAGNMTADPQDRTFIYDSENKQVRVEHILQNSPTNVAQYFSTETESVSKRSYPGPAK